MQPEYEGMYNLIGTVLTIAVTWMSKHYVDIYATSKKRITIIKNLLDDVDAALQDDQVTDEEFKGIFAHVKELIQK